jgi:hypothetical protein
MKSGMEKSACLNIINNLNISLHAAIRPLADLQTIFTH